MRLCGFKSHLPHKCFEKPLKTQCFRGSFFFVKLLTSVDTLLNGFWQTILFVEVVPDDSNLCKIFLVSEKV